MNPSTTHDPEEAHIIAKIVSREETEAGLKITLKVPWSQYPISFRTPLWPPGAPSARQLRSGSLWRWTLRRGKLIEGKSGDQSFHYYWNYGSVTDPQSGDVEGWAGDEPVRSTVPEQVPPKLQPQPPPPATKPTPQSQSAAELFPPIPAPVQEKPKPAARPVTRPIPAYNAPSEIWCRYISWDGLVGKAMDMAKARSQFTLGEMPDNPDDAYGALFLASFRLICDAVKNEIGLKVVLEEGADNR